MHSNQLILLGVLFLTFVAVQLVSAGGGGHGHGHGHGGRRNGTGCRQGQQFFQQWFPQSVLAAAFQAVCRQVGATQAWTSLQGLLGIPTTGALDQATFQALLSNSDHVLIAQQLLTLVGSVTTVRSFGK